MIRPDFVLDDGVAVEVDGPYHYSSEPSASVLAGLEDADAGLDDWFAGADATGTDAETETGTDAETETGTDAETETMEGPPGVGPGGDGERAGGGPWPLGSTVLRNQLLRAWGWTVVTVTYHEWERAGTAEAKRAYVGKVTRRRRAEAAIERRRREVAGEKPSLK